MSAQCPNCGSEVTGGRFCPECGNNIESLFVQETQSVVQEPTDVIMSEQPAEPTNSVEPIESVNLVEPASMMEPIETVNAVEPTNQAADVIPPIEMPQPVIQPVEVIPENPTNSKKSKKAKKVKAPKAKKKKKFRWGLLVLVVILVIVIGLPIAGYFYLGNSSIDYDVEVKRHFDEQEFLNEKSLEDFNGRVLETAVEEGILNYYVRENKALYEDLSLPMDIEVDNVAFSANDECVYIDLKGGFVNTTLKVNIGFEVEDDRLFVVIDRLSLGSMGLPLPKDMILNQLELPDEYEEGLEIPELMTIESIGFKKDELQIEAELTEEFLEEFESICTESLNEERLNFLINGYNGEEGVELAYLLNSWDGSDETEAIIYQCFTNKDRFAELFGVMEQEGVEELLDLLADQVSYIDQKAIDNLKAESDRLHEEFTSGAVFQDIFNNVYIWAGDSNSTLFLDLDLEQIRVYDTDWELYHFGTITDYDIENKQITYTITDSPTSEKDSFTFIVTIIDDETINTEDNYVDTPIINDWIIY